MRILLVNDYGSLVGGAEIQMVGLRDALRARGHEVRFFASSARPGGEESQADYECLGTTSHFRTLLQSANPWAYHRLRRVLATFRPDVVHVKLFLTQLSPLILPLLRSVPSVYHVAWYRPVCPLGTKMLPDGSACHDPWGRACYRHGCLPLRDWGPLMAQMQAWHRWRDAFDLIVANSETTKAHLVADGIEPVEVVWYGLPEKAVRTALAPRPTVAFAGRLVAEKGLDVLVRAFARVASEVPEARLLIAGEGPERPRLEALVDDLGLTSRVAWLGYVSRDDLEHAFAPAWVQVAPGRWAEPFGLTAAEAMLRGTALVASNTGGPSEFVQDGRTGCLVPPGDVDALARVLRRLLGNPEQVRRLGDAARVFALEQLSEDAFVRRFLELYASIRTPQKRVQR